MNRSRSSRRTRTAETHSEKSSSNFANWYGLVPALAAATGVSYSAWAFGGVLAKHQVAWIAVGMLAFALAWIGTTVSSANRWRVSSIALLILAGIGWGFLQIVPLPISTLGRLDESRQEAKQETSGVEKKDSTNSPGVAKEDSESGAATTASTESKQASSGWRTASQSPAATRWELAILIGLAAYFVVGNQFGSSTTVSMWTFFLLGLNGTAIAIFGIVQQMHFDSKIYGIYEGHGQSFAAFVNPNNAGGYLNIALAASIGFSGWVLFRQNRDSIYADLSGSDFYAETWFFKMRRFIAELDAFKIGSILLPIACAAGVLCTLSRGAIVAMIFGLLVTSATLLFAKHARLGFIAMLLLGIGGVGLAAWVGMTDAIGTELSTLQGEKLLKDGRITLWNDLWPMAGDFWVTGSGLGTFRDVYRSYITFEDRVWFYHAENMYVEAALDAGIFGLMLMVAAIAATWYLASRLVVGSHDLPCKLAGIAGIFALSSQALHAALDFGLYIPANAAAMALLIGVVASQPMKFESSRARWFVGVNRDWLALAVGGVLFCGLVWSFQTLSSRARLDQSLELTKSLMEPKPIPMSQLTEWEKTLPAVVKLADTPEGWNRLGRLYEAKAQRVVFDREYQGAKFPEDSNEAIGFWALADSRQFHRQNYVAFEAFGEVGVEQRLKGLPETEFYRQAYAAWANGGRLNPYLVESSLALAKLSAVERISGDLVYLERAIASRPTNIDFVLQAANLHLQAGRRKEGARLLQQAIATSPDRASREAAVIARRWLDEETIRNDLAPRNGRDGYRFAAEFPRTGSWGRMRRELMQDLVERQEEAPSTLAADCWGAFLAASEIEDDKLAEKWMLAGLNEAPFSFDYQLAAANWYYFKRELQVARQHIRRALALRPDAAQAQQLDDKIEKAIQNPLEPIR